MITFLKYLAENFQKKFTWKYFATSHGKGVFDGVGGRIKSLVRLAVTSKKSKRTIVQNSEDFVRTANSLTCKTQVLHVAENEIEAHNDIWKQSRPYPGISKCHIIIAEPGDEAKLFDNAETIKSDVRVEPEPSTSK